MKLTNLAPNANVVSNDRARILFSYETPVAAMINGVYYKTEKKFSKTTSKHINLFINGEPTVEPQEFFDNL